MKFASLVANQVMWTGASDVLPAGAVDITHHPDVQAGWVYAPALNAFSPPPVVTDPLDPYSQWSEQIDVAAGRARLRFISTGPGQDAVYQLKYEEALRYQEAGYPDSTDDTTWPFMIQEALGTAQTLREVADSVVQMRQLWGEVAALIERFRVGGKHAIATLGPHPDPRQMFQIVSQTIAALEAIRP